MSGWTDAFDRTMRELSAENASLNNQRVRDISAVIEGIQQVEADHLRLLHNIEMLRQELRALEMRLKNAGFDI